MVSFSTHSLPADQKAASWAEFASHHLGSVDIAPQHPSRFDARLQRLSMGPIVLTDVLCSAVRVQHTRQHASRMSSIAYTLYMPIQRGFQLSVAHELEIQVNSGEICLVDQATPYHLTHGDSVRTLCLSFPKRYLHCAQPYAKHIAGRVITSDHATARILMSFLRELSRELNENGTEELPHSFSRVLLDLVAEMCAAQRPGTDGQGIRTRAQAFREFIDGSFTDPKFKQATVARRFNVSERYVRAAMREEGTSFSSYVLNRRLERSWRLLREPDLKSATITDIALRAGFNSASHFGRVFKNEYGISPREFRIVNTS